MPNRHVISSKGLREIKKFVNDKKYFESGGTEGSAIFPPEKVVVKKEKRKGKARKKVQPVPYSKENQIKNSTELVALRRNTIQKILNTGKYSRREVAEIMGCTYATILSDEVEFESLNVPIETVITMHDMVQSGEFTHSDISKELNIDLSTVILLTLGLANQTIATHKVIQIRNLYKNKGVPTEELIAHFTVSQQGMKKILADLLPVKMGGISKKTIYEIRQCIVSESFRSIVSVAVEYGVTERIVKKYGRGLLPKRKMLSDETIRDIQECYKTGKYSKRALAEKFSVGPGTITSHVAGVELAEGVDPSKLRSERQAPLQLYV